MKADSIQPLTYTQNVVSPDNIVVGWFEAGHD